jgi:acyl-CoA reductase-like NAD-dependent aldehyde dehydrogenase
VSTAIEVRENAIIAAHDAFAVSLKSALTVRRDALKAAWNIADKTARETARKAAWTTFKTSSQAAHTAMRTARVAAWTTFNTSAIVCGVKNHGEKSQKIENPTYSY